MKTYLLACSGYSAEKENDILIVKVDETGQYQICHSYRQGQNPSFGVRRDDCLYTVEEVDHGAAIRAWKVHGEQLEITDMRIEVPGAALCHLYAGESALFGSSYLTGDFFAVDYDLKEILWHRAPGASADTALEAEACDAKCFCAAPNPENDRQECPHAHWISLCGEELLLADLGSDRIWRYRMANGLPEEELEPLCLDRGAGPRQPLPVAGTEGDSVSYVLSVQELDSTLCLWKRVGEKFVCVDKIRTTAHAEENFPGTICMADERTVLVCNRGANTVAAVKSEGEALQLAGEWETANWPRHIMRVADTNLFVNSCDRAGKLVIFAWENGQLAKCSEIELPGASCAALL